MAWRDLRASPGHSLAAILVIAAGTGAMNGVRSTAADFRSRMRGDARQWITGDVSVNVKELPDERQAAVLEGFARQGVERTLITESISMVSSDSTPDPAIASIKAVEPDRYPLYGEVELSPPIALGEALNEGTAVVSPDLLDRMQARIGDSLRVGRTVFRIAAAIAVEPDRFALAPDPLMRVILSRKGLDRTRIVRLGNSVGHRLAFRLPPGIEPSDYRARMEELFPQADVVDYRDPDPRAIASLDASVAFMNLGAWVALVAGSLGAGMAMYLHLRSRLDSVAIMKAVGGRSEQIVAAYAFQATGLALAGGVLGSGLGRVLERSFAALLERYLYFHLAIRWDWTIALEAIALSVIATLLATAVPLLNARTIPPGVLLRRQSWDGPAAPARRAAWIAAGFAVTGFGWMAARLMQSWRGGAMAMLCLTTGAAILLAGARGLLALTRWASPRHAPLARLSLNRRGHESRTMVAALAAGVALLSATRMAQVSISDAVARSLPMPGSDLYLIGAGAPQIEGLKKLLGSQPGVTGHVETAPVVWLRLAKINGVPIERLPGRIHRMRLATCGDREPPGARMADGRWWTSPPPAPMVIASNDTAQELNVSPGDELELAAPGRAIHARVAGIRHLNATENIWLGLTFNCGAFEGLNVFYHTGVAVGSDRVPEVRRAVSEEFPTVGIINRGELLAVIEGVAGRGMAMMRYLSLLVLLSGGILMSLIAAASNRIRLRETSILKSLGARRAKLIRLLLGEFGLQGVLAGTLGGLLGSALATVAVSAVLRRTVIAIEWRVLGAACVATPVLAIMAGWLATRRTLDHKPLETLRDE